MAEFEKLQKRKRVNKRWKAAEDWFVNQSGAKPLGHFIRGKDCADAVDSLFSYDITTTEKPLAFIEKEMVDAQIHAAGSTRVPVVVIFRAGEDRKNGLVVMRVSDWLDLHGDGKK